MQAYEPFVTPNDHEQGKIYIKFSTRAVQDQAASLTQGRPMFVDVDYIHKVVPGDPTSEIIRPVRASDILEYGRQYHDWKSGQMEALSGTPLAEWPGISRSQAEELAFFKIRTVEQLANVSDVNIQKIGPVQHLKQKAIDYLERSKGTAVDQQFRAEHDRMKATIQAQENQIEQLRAALTAKSTHVGGQIDALQQGNSALPPTAQRSKK